MNWVLTVIFCAVLVEVVLRLPFLAAVKCLASSSRRAMRVVTASSVSDHWKERAMGAYARMAFVATGKIAVLLATVLGLAVALVVGIEHVLSGFQGFVTSWAGLTFSVVAACLYAFLRKTILDG